MAAQTHQTHHFKLGLFLILGFLLFAAALTYFGSGSFFANILPAETYFRESVQGLSVGSPVKYRGVQIGSVADIGFVAGKYPKSASELRRLVLVHMELDMDEAWGASPRLSRDNLAQQVEQGLRVKLSSQGLTGVVYLEADYFPATKYPPLALDFTPTALYIPTAPSTMYQVGQSLETISNILGKINAIDFSKLIRNTNNLLTNINAHIENADIARLGQLVAQNLEELHKGLGRINVLLADPAAESILPNTAQAMADVKTLVADVRGPIQSTVDQLRAAASSLAAMSGRLESLAANQGLEETFTLLPQAVAKAQNATVQLARDGQQLGQLLTAFRQMVQAQQSTIQTILTEAESVLRNLNEFTEEAKRNPSRLFLGSPPGHSTLDTANDQ